MKKLFNIRTILSLALMLALGSCQYDQEVEDPISPDDYTVATFETDFSGNTVTEGDTINYTITLSKPIDVDLEFVVMMNDGTANEADYTFTETIIPAYATQAEMMIVFVQDNIPELAATATLEVGVDYLGTKYLLNPSTVNPVLDLTIENFNHPAGLTIAYGWEDEHNDIDLFSLFDDVDGIYPDYDNGDGQVSWDAAASSDNPEIMLSSSADPPGTYLIGIDPFHVEGSTVNYTFSIGYPDQTVEFYTGVFNMDEIDSYTPLYFDVWDMYVYHLMDVELMNDGSFEVTHLYE